MEKNYVKDILKEIDQTVDFISLEKTEKFVHEIMSSNRIFSAGAGRSGFMMRSFAMRLMHLGIDSYVVGETTTPSIKQGDLLIIGSGSGLTASLINIAQKARDLEASIILISINKVSPLGNLADLVIPIPASTPKLAEEPNSISIQPMGSLFEQSLLLYLDSIILYLMDRKAINASEMFSRHANLE